MQQKEMYLVEGAAIDGAMPAVRQKMAATVEARITKKMSFQSSRCERERCVEKKS
jgi:hypothetical protein